MVVEAANEKPARSTGRGGFNLFGNKAGGKEDTADMAAGQQVIIAARWILVATGLMLALWAPSDVVDLRVQILMILGLAGANFYLHTQVLVKRPVLTTVAYAASAADLAAISMIVIAGGGASSSLYVFYFPAILAYSVAAMAAYGMTYLATSVGDSPEILVLRLLLIAAVEDREELRAQVHQQAS